MKRVLRPFLGLGILAALAIVGPSARADLIIDSVIGGAPTGANYAKFDDLPLGAFGGATNVAGAAGTTLTVAFGGTGQAVQGAASNFYAAPFLSAANATNFGNLPTTGPDTSTYLSTGIGSVELTFSGPQQHFGLLWGSVDAYNSLEFFNGGTSVGLLTGADVAASANGDQGVNGTFYVNISSSLSFDRVVASSTQYAFEFDNVAVGAVANLHAVPEPGSLAMAGIGLSLVGVAALRRRRLAAKAQAAQA